MDRIEVAAQERHASLTAVTKVYEARAGLGPVPALGPIDLQLRQGEFFPVVGPSGCGKSTLGFGETSVEPHHSLIITPRAFMGTKYREQW